MSIPTFKANIENDIKIIDKQTVYRGFFAVNHYLIQHRLFAGHFSPTFEREVIEKIGAAAALLYDPILDKVVLLEQFRVGALTDPEGPWLLEIVAGILEPNESPEDLVLREAQEEAGLAIFDLHFITRYWVTPGISTEQLTLFCAKVDANKADGIHGLPEEGEDIRLIVVPFEEAYQAIENGQIKNAPTLIALQWLKLNKEQMQKKWID
jgi:ADP-ribose pyrophosphatase